MPPESQLREPNPEPHTPRPTLYTSRLPVRIGRPVVSLDAPSHTPGTNRGEERIFSQAEEGRAGTARTARSSTSINPGQRDPIDPRMPYLPPA